MAHSSRHRHRSTKRPMPVNTSKRPGRFWKFQGRTLSRPWCVPGRSEDDDKDGEDDDERDEERPWISKAQLTARLHLVSRSSSRAQITIAASPANLMTSPPWPINGEAHARPTQTHAREAATKGDLADSRKIDKIGQESVQPVMLRMMIIRRTDRKTLTSLQMSRTICCM